MNSLTRIATVELSILRGRSYALAAERSIMSMLMMKDYNRSISFQNNGLCLSIQCSSVGTFGNIPRLMSVDLIGNKNQVILQFKLGV